MLSPRTRRHVPVRRVRRGVYVRVALKGTAQGANVECWSPARQIGRQSDETRTGAPSCAD